MNRATLMGASSKYPFVARMTKLGGALAASAFVLVFALSGPGQAQTPPKLKMTTDIPSDITTPDSVESRIGTLKLFDGFPDDATTQKVYDNLDFQRG